MSDIALPKRRWFQSRLRTLLLLVLLASIGMGWVAVRMQEAKRQREAVRMVTELGGFVLYEGQFDSSGLSPPAWL